ncbi:hypothetical protein SRHO_G00071300 [Serrasalmus rhombeus]
MAASIELGRRRKPRSRVLRGDGVAHPSRLRLQKSLEAKGTTSEAVSSPRCAKVVCVPFGSQQSTPTQMLRLASEVCNRGG